MAKTIAELYHSDIENSFDLDHLVVAMNEPWKSEWQSLKSTRTGLN